MVVRNKGRGEVRDATSVIRADREKERESEKEREIERETTLIFCYSDSNWATHLSFALPASSTLSLFVMDALYLTSV
jgi:hypothetical protein